MRKIIYIRVKSLNDSEDYELALETQFHKLELEHPEPLRACIKSRKALEYLSVTILR